MDETPSGAWTSGRLGGRWRAGPSAVPNVDDIACDAVKHLVRAAQTHDRVEIKRALDATLSLTRSRWLAVVFLLRVSSWCSLTSMQKGQLTPESVWAVADEIYPQVSQILDVSPEIVFSVLDEARFGVNQQGTALGDARRLLTSAVALVELMRRAPPPGNDVEAILGQSVQCLLSDSPDDVARAWLARIGP